MPGHRWFEITDSNGFTETETAFAAGLSDRTASWASVAFGDSLFRGEALVATLSLADPVQKLGIVDFGIHFQGGRVRGDRVHSELFTLPAKASPWALSAAGSVGALADAAALWLRTVVRKPVALYVWLRAGTPCAARYAFADTGETISECLMGEGGYGGEPDLFFRISGDFSTAVMLGATRHGGQRYPLDGVWTATPPS